MDKVITRACGKLYIAGEFAVVAGRGAIIAPVKKYIEVIMRPADDYYIKNTNYEENFTKLDLNNNNQDYIYVVKTIKWFLSYLEELNIGLQFVSIEIHSELNYNDKKKFGLGSSAAIVIALLKALFEFYGLHYNNMALFKAGVLIQGKIAKATSFGDLACIAFEKLIYYRKFDNNILNQNLPIIDLLNMDWKGLVIEELNLNLYFLTVYTNHPANSFSLVEKVFAFNKDKGFKLFLERSEELVLSLKKNKKDIKTIINNLDINLRYLNALTKTDLIIPEMDDIKKIISPLKGSMKFSGAGGGDCVICFFNNSTDLNEANKLLVDNGYLVHYYQYHEVEQNESKK